VGVCCVGVVLLVVFFFQAEDGIRDWSVTGVQTCALPICPPLSGLAPERGGRWDGASAVGVIPIAPAQPAATAAASVISNGRASRSEERRVGKEGRCRGWPCEEKEKEGEDREKCRRVERGG